MSAAGPGSDAGDEGFLSRWSRRKAEGRPAPEAARSRPTAAQAFEPPVALDPGVARPARASHDASPAPQAAVPPVDPAPAPGVPTWSDLEALTPASDYSGFVQARVPQDLKNAALKKLFADPHFNVMDGLDIYIEDYGRPDPLPAAWLRQLTQSRMLGLFDDERERAGAAPASVGTDARNAPTEPAPTCPPRPEAPDNENADLQLQPDDAAGRARPGPGGPVEP